MNDIDLKINEIQAEFYKFHLSSIHYNYFVDCPELDKKAQEIGRITLENKKLDYKTLKSFNQDIVVFITSFVLDNGGHTRVIEDYIDIYRDYNKKCVVIITENGTFSSARVIKKLQEQGVEFLYSNGKPRNRIEQLQDYLLDIRPEQTFVFTGIDVVIFSALQKILVSKLYWYLNLDHSLSIGVHIPFITKIVISRPYLMHYFKNLLKFNEDKILHIPLTKADKADQSKFPRKYCINGYIITASCTSAYYKISNDYKYKYIDVIPQILNITKGKHIHIGKIEKEQVGYIRNKLKEYSIDDNRFVVINHTDSLVNFLLQNDVDILVNTFPVGGGLVCTEAMQAGVAIISHANVYSYLYNMSDMLYDKAYFWKKQEELFEYLTRLDKTSIEQEGIRARDFYNKNLSNVKKYIKPDLIVGLKVDYENIANDYAYSLDIYNYIIDLNLKCFNNKIRNNKTNLFKKIRKKIRMIFSFKKRFK